MTSFLRFATISFVVFAGCHRDAGTAAVDAAPAASTGTVAAASGGSNADADPSCALVTKAEAEAIAGEPLQDLTVSVSGMCEYRLESDKGKRMTMPIFGLKLYPGESKATFESQAKNAASIMHETLKPASGFGEEAYEVGAFQYMVLEHGKAISATHLGKGDAAKFTAFVRKALSKL